MRAEIPFELIDPTADNARKKFVHVPDLALSIADHGLIQNLVVRRKVDAQGGVRYVCEAGERRRQAIALLMLEPAEQLRQYGMVLGSWLGSAAVKSGCPSGDVPCFIIPDSSDDVVHMLENIQREDLWPWEIGRRLVSWNDAGYDQRFIATRLYRSQSTISEWMMFGRCLSPKVTAALETIGDKHFLGKRALLKLCRYYDPVLQEPQHEKQVEALETILGTARTVKREGESRSERIRVFERAKKLGTMRGVPGHARPYVKAIYEYLFGPQHVKPNWDFK